MVVTVAGIYKKHVALFVSSYGGIQGGGGTSFVYSSQNNDHLLYFQISVT